jgi:hypothetical protein
VAVLTVAALGAGIFAVSPATAGKFLTKKRALKLFYTKDALYKKTESDARFLHDVVVVVESDSVANNVSDRHQVPCPPGTEAIGGGVSPNFTSDMFVTMSSPTIGGQPVSAVSDGTHQAADGWEAAIKNEHGTQQPYKVGVICAAP